MSLNRLGNITKNIRLSDFVPGMYLVEVRRVTFAGTSFIAGQQTLRLLWTKNVHCRVRNSARLTLLCMSHMTKIHPFTSLFLIININIVPPFSLRFSSRIFLSGLPPTKFLYKFIFSHMHATRTNHIILDALTIIIDISNLEHYLRYKIISQSTNVLNVTHVMLINVTVLLPCLTSQLHQ